MEGAKQVCGSSSSSSSSSSSLASELFGSRETYPAAASSSTGIFGSIFGSPSNANVIGKKFLCSESEMRTEFSSKSGTAADDTTKSQEGKGQSATNGETSSIYQEQGAQPCHLSSSIYYGGQEDYSQPRNKGSSMNSASKKDPGEDDSDSGTASRGNWWQGSLYY